MAEPQKQPQKQSQLPAPRAEVESVEAVGFIRDSEGHWSAVLVRARPDQVVKRTAPNLFAIARADAKVMMVDLWERQTP